MGTVSLDREVGALILNVGVSTRRAMARIGYFQKRDRWVKVGEEWIDVRPSSEELEKYPDRIGYLRARLRAEVESRLRERGVRLLRPFTW